MSPAIGQPIDRVDGRAKVIGAGRYSAEIALDNMAYAVLVGAHVPSGRISVINTSEAESAEGVLAILTHHNLERVAAQPPPKYSSIGRDATSASRGRWEPSSLWSHCSSSNTF